MNPWNQGARTNAEPYKTPEPKARRKTRTRHTKHSNTSLNIPCPLREDIFRNNGLLKRHIAGSHDPDSPLGCSEPGYKAMLIHMRVHREEICCKVCGSTFMSV